MKKQGYLKICDFYKKNKRLITVLNNAVTYLIAVAYIVFLVYCFLTKNERGSFYFAVPLTGFIVVSFFRNFLNSQRPYEKYPELATEGILKKGKSFPSRHTFSAFIISFMFLDFNLYFGVAFLMLSVLMGILRVLSLKHFVKDVFASFIFAIIVYIIDYFVI